MLSATGVTPSQQSSHLVAVWTSPVLSWSPANEGACFIYDVGLLVHNQRNDIKVKAKLLYRKADDGSSIFSKDLFTAYPVERTRDYVDIKLEDTATYQVIFSLESKIFIFPRGFSIMNGSMVTH